MVKKMSKKNLDQNGRLRNVVVGFRMSEEEVDLLNRRVLISGLTKQEFIINSILGKEVTVYGNPYVFRSLQDELIKFIKLYGKGLEDENDDEMLELTLKTDTCYAKKRKDRSLSCISKLSRKTYFKGFFNVFTNL